MKNEIVKEIAEAYKNDELDKLFSSLFFLVLSYNSSIEDGNIYDHDLKHILFKTDCVRNPMGIRYGREDYEKTMRTYIKLLNSLNAINDPSKNTGDILRSGIKIDERIIKDIKDIIAYTDCLYKMNSVNSKRIEESEISKLSFVEQLLNVILFHQDQTRLVRQQYETLMTEDKLTGMELSIANKDVQYCDGLKCSISDNFESILESANEIVRYLYYRWGKHLPEQLIEKNINFDLITPHENIEFEKYLYIAAQRYFLCRVEEGIRYGYYQLGGIDKTEEGISRFAYILENNEKFKARRLGIFRREYEVRKHVLSNYETQLEVLVAHEKILALAEELISNQDKDYILLNVNDFYPNKNIFHSAEKISKIKEDVIETLTKKYYLDCEVKEVKIRDLICAYKYLCTLAEILYFASEKLIDADDQSTYIKELCIVNIDYLAIELSRIHDFEESYASKLIDRFVFHEKDNREDDVFAQPLLKISQTQVVLSQALIDQLNLDRFIERQFIRYKINISDVGYTFENYFINTLKKGYLKDVLSYEYEEIPNFKVNENQVKYNAFDGKEIEFDGISVLGEYLILTELKSVMTSYDLNDLEERKKTVKTAVKQLQRRAESVKYDWEKIKEKVSIELPESPFDQEHIILVACTDTYDYTPLKIGNVFITDDSSYLKYFTNPYFDVIEVDPGKITIRKIKDLWKNAAPDAMEFMEYLMNPITTQQFTRCMEKQWFTIPMIDDKDYSIYCEDYKLMEDPIIKTLNENSIELKS